MKSILIFSLLLLSLSNFDNENKKISGKYKVEFRDSSYQNFMIDFSENDYTKTNLNNETIGKGKIVKNVKENEEGIIILQNYIIPNKTLESSYLQIWFTKKDTIRFGIYSENEPHFSIGGGIMIKIRN